MLKHKLNKKTRKQGENRIEIKKRKENGLEHIPQNKKLFILILTVLLSQIYSQSNKND